jgi:hexosaminidase
LFITRRLAPLPLAFVLTTHASAEPEQGPAVRSVQELAAERRTLMPVPASVKWAEGLLRLDTATTFGLTRFSDDRLRRGLDRALARLRTQTGVSLPPILRGPATAPVIAIDVDSAGQRVQSVDEDESYSLTIDPLGGRLKARTVVGALRGLETLLQLVESDRFGFYLPVVTIDDAPRFRWRGLLMDVSRHFMPVETVKRTLDGMAAVKLNVFHWHLTDDQGIRVESRRYPRLHRVASDSQYYTQAQIRDIVAYARDRGIRVLPEFDMPGHSTAWFVAYPQFASRPGRYEIQRVFGGSTAVFDPTREEVYTFIDRFIGEMATLFPDRYWHIGGDEVDYRKWDTRRIRAFRRQRGFRNGPELQAYFNQRLTRILLKHNRRLVGWDEIIHPRLPKASVVQSWRGVDFMSRATAQGYLSILSAPYYLDHIKTTEEYYSADPIPPWTELEPAQQDLVLGGEACMWAEHVSPETVDSRIWPRMAAIAERFWSPREVIQVGDMYRRLETMSERLEQFGLTHAVHTERMVRRIATEDSAQAALRAMLEAVGPPTFSQRVRGQRTTQLTPLVGMIDAAIPDPPGRWRTSQLVDRIVTDSLSTLARVDTALSVAEARSRLAASFAHWRDLAPVIRRAANTSPMVGDALPAAEALSRTAVIGLQAIGYLSGGPPAPPEWTELAMEELRRYEEPQNLLRVMIVPSVRRLVSAAGVRP